MQFVATKSIDERSNSKGNFFILYYTGVDERRQNNSINVSFTFEGERCQGQELISWAVFLILAM